MRAQVTHHGSVDVWEINTVGRWSREQVLGDVMMILGSMCGGHLEHGSMVALRCEHHELRMVILSIMLATVYQGAAVWRPQQRQYQVITGQGEQWAVGECFVLGHVPSWDSPEHVVRMAERIIARGGAR